MEQYFRNRTQLSEPDLQRERRANDGRLKSRFEHIFAKYEKDFTGIGDEIDLDSGEVVVNNGHLENMRHEVDPGKGTGAQLVRAFAEGLENESEESTSEDGDDDEDEGNGSTPEAEDKDNADSSSSSGYTSSGIVTDHEGGTSSRSTPVEPDELSSDFYPDEANSASRGKKRKRKSSPTVAPGVIGDREGSKPSGASTTSNEISRSATPADLPQNLLENLPFLKDSMRAMEDRSKQIGRLDPNAIQALGQSIANQLAQYVADGPNKAATKPQPQQPAPRFSIWDYPELPGDERARTPPPPLAPISSSAALFSMSPVGGPSIWAPIQYPRARKKRPVYRASLLAIDPALESDGEDPLQSDSPRHTPVRTFSRDDESQLLPEMEVMVLGGVPRSCYNCGDADTPNFRKGPDGDLCNACGMYYYRYGLMKPQFEPEPSPPRPEPEPGTFSVLVPPGHAISQTDLAEFDIPITPVSNDHGEEESYPANTGRRIVAGGARISRFTKEEDEIIIKCREVDDLSWEVIGRLVSGRSAFAVQNRYSSELKQNPSEARSSLLEQGYRVQRIDSAESEADPIIIEEDEPKETVPEDDHVAVSIIDPFLLGGIEDVESAESTANASKGELSSIDKNDNAFRLTKRFTEGEDQLIKRLRDEDRLTWEEIHEHIPGRTILALQKRYHRELMPKRLQVFDKDGNIDLENFEADGLRNIRYSEEEDELIRKMKEEEKMSFAEMTEFFIGRSEDSLANRYRYMKAHNPAMMKATPSLNATSRAGPNDNDFRLTVGEMFGSSAFTGNVHSPYRTPGDTATPPAQSAPLPARYGEGALARNRNSLRLGVPVAVLGQPQTPAAPIPQARNPPRPKQVGPAAWDATQPASHGPLPFKPARKGPRHPTSASKRPARPDPFATSEAPSVTPQQPQLPPPIPIHVLLQKPLPVFSPPMTQQDKEMMSFVPHLHILPSQIAHSTLLPSQILCIPPRPQKAAYGSYKPPSHKRMLDHRATPVTAGQTHVYSQSTPANSVQTTVHKLSGVPSSTIQTPSNGYPTTPARATPNRPLPLPIDDDDDDEIVFLGSKSLRQSDDVIAVNPVDDEDAHFGADMRHTRAKNQATAFPRPTLSAAMQPHPMSGSPHTPIYAPPHTSMTGTPPHPEMPAPRSAVMRPRPRRIRPAPKSGSSRSQAPRPTPSSRLNSSDNVPANCVHSAPIVRSRTYVAGDSAASPSQRSTTSQHSPLVNTTAVLRHGTAASKDNIANAPLLTSAAATTDAPSQSSNTQLPKEFTNEEDRLIRRWRERDGCCWSEIATRLPHRTQQAVTDRYYGAIIGKAAAARAAAAAANAASRDPSDPKYDYRFTDVESDTILELNAQGLSFEDMAEQLPGRSAESIQHHFNNALSTTKKTRKDQTPNRFQITQTPLLRQALSNSARRGSIGIAEAEAGYAHFTLKPPRTRPGMAVSASTPEQRLSSKSQEPQDRASFPSSPPVDSAISLQRYADTLDDDDAPMFIPYDEPDLTEKPLQVSAHAELRNPETHPDYTSARSQFRYSTPSPPLPFGRLGSAEYESAIYPETPSRATSDNPYYSGTSPGLALVYETPARSSQHAMPYFVAPTARMFSPEAEQSRPTTAVDMSAHDIDPSLARNSTVSPVDELVGVAAPPAKHAAPKPKAVQQKRQPSTRKPPKRRRGDEDDTEFLEPAEKIQAKPKQPSRRPTKRKPQAESGSESLSNTEAEIHQAITIQHNDHQETESLMPAEKQQVRPKRPTSRVSKRRPRAESGGEPFFDTEEEMSSAEEQEGDSPRRFKRRPKKPKFHDDESDTLGESPPPASDPEDYIEVVEAVSMSIEPPTAAAHRDEHTPRGRKRQKTSPGPDMDSWAGPWIELITKAITSTEDKRMLSRDILQWIRDHDETYFETRDWEPNIRRALTLRHIFKKIDNGQSIHYWTLNEFAESATQQLLTPTSVNAGDSRIQDAVIENVRSAGSSSGSVSTGKAALEPPGKPSDNVDVAKAKNSKKRKPAKHLEHVRIISLALASTPSGHMQSKDIIAWIKENVDEYRDRANLEQTVRTTLRLGQEFTKIDPTKRRCDWKLSDVVETPAPGAAITELDKSEATVDDNQHSDVGFVDPKTPEIDGGNDELSGDNSEHSIAAITVHADSSTDPLKSASSTMHSVGSVHVVDGDSTVHASFAASAPGHDDKTSVASARPSKDPETAPERPEHTFAVPAAVCNDKKHRHSDPVSRLGGSSARRSMTPLRSARKATSRNSRASTPRFEAIRRVGGPLEALGRSSSVQPAFSRAGSVALPSGRRIVMACTVGANEQGGDDDELA